MSLARSDDPPRTGAPGWRTGTAGAVITLALAFSPLLLIHLLAYFGHHDISWQQPAVSLAFAAGFSALLWLRPRQGPARWLATALLLALYLLFLMTAAALTALHDFTGRGFTDEVFHHAEIYSLIIAANEYGVHFLGVFIIFCGFAFLMARAGHRSRSLGWVRHGLLLGGTLATVLTAGYFSPAGALGKGYLKYLNRNPAADSRDHGYTLEDFARLGILRAAGGTPKEDITATAAPTPKNLILVYLESFSTGLLDHPDYPDLAPNLTRLATRYQARELLSSAYVTVEGIVASQCGILLPHFNLSGNDTLMREGSGTLSRLACLGDVLRAAGYTQYYLGGALSSFAGKGSFLKSHGYDHVRGWRHWRNQGHEESPGQWGLGDDKLLAEAMATIAQARATPPFNVTLLTLGTHLPGYSYEGCVPYAADVDHFVNAIHCTDQLVGRFVQELEERGHLEDTLLMMVADHGVFPTPDMRQVFGSMVEDLRLLAITNYAGEIPAAEMATYDLAPTLLDMLDVSHNVSFLYGISALAPTRRERHFVTRYEDWGDGRMRGNRPGACRMPTQLRWPLTVCEKAALSDLTTTFLESHSGAAPAEKLACRVTVNAELGNGDGDSYLTINGTDHYNHFYLDGYFMQDLHMDPDAGIFLFVLGTDNEIVSHRYFAGDQRSLRTYARYWEQLDAAKTLTVIKPTDEMLAHDDLPDSLRKVTADRFYLQVAHSGVITYVMDRSRGIGLTANVCD